MRRILILLIALVLVSVPVGVSATEQRIALVIGNSNYKNAPLRNPANDATDISRALKRLGFQVTMLRNADQRKMEDSIRKFGKTLSKGGVGLFYYAGHGMQVDGRNYLIPVDARIEDPSDVKYEALDAGRVLGKMEVAGNDMNIVILDACRDNPFSRSWRSGQKGLARMDAPKGSYISYATAPGSVAADGSGRNGTFTKSLLRHIEVPGLTLESVMKRVRKDVIDETGSKQIPWSSSSIIGDFYFDPTKIQPTQPGRAIDVQKKKNIHTIDAEEEMWGIVKTSKSIEDYTSFLNEFPNSRFSGSARLRIQQLKRKQNAQAMTAAVAPTVVKPKPVKSVIESAASSAGIVAIDGTYTKYSTGIVYDKATGLEWYAGPDRDMSFYEAKNWINSLNVDGTGWRSPNQKDLRSLYRKKSGTRNITPLLETTGWSVWAHTTADTGGGWVYRYYYRGNGTWGEVYPSSTSKMRAFAVRTRN
jgi:hypothetical protein